MNEHDPNCIDCDIEAKANESNPIWIADLQVSSAFLNPNQICRGYTVLVFNKGHFTELFQLENEDRTAYIDDLMKVAEAIQDAFHPNKMNYELLGNIVPHLHWHIIPRRKTDSIDIHWPIWGKDYTEVTLSDDELCKIVEEIRAHLYR